MNLSLQLHFNIKVEVQPQPQLFIFTTTAALFFLALVSAQDAADGLARRVGHPVDGVTGGVLHEFAGLVDASEAAQRAAVSLGLAALAALATGLLGGLVHSGFLASGSLGTRASASRRLFLLWLGLGLGL